jgi:cysteine-rich repeat protein
MRIGVVETERVRLASILAQNREEPETVRAASNILSTGAVGDHVRMYAPAAFNQGSSVSHWDTVLVPNQSQEPSYTMPIHDPGLSLPLLCDVGWGPCLCGNGVIDPGEGCDDDATISGDGCGATCQVEECWSCAGAPSVCTPLGSGTGCTDQNPCTQTDQCDGGGTCVGSNPVVCTPLDDCHAAGTCTPATGQCSNPPAADGTACDDGDTCTNPDQCLSGTCTGLPDCIDPFLCYKAKSAKVGGAFQAPPAQTLVDEFNEVVDFNVVKPRYLCTPAEKNSEAQADIATHLEGYAIKAVKGEPPHLPRQFLTVRNQLNAPLNVIVVDTVKPELLLVPTAKNLAFDPPAPGGGIEVDHYKCYKIKVAKGTPKFPKDVSITLADQFIASAQVFSVVKPTHLCTPVDKEGEGIKHSAIHQLCYSVKRSVKNPQHLGLYTHNQFGAERLDTIQESRVCVPSIVE